MPLYLYHLPRSKEIVAASAQSGENTAVSKRVALYCNADRSAHYLHGIDVLAAAKLAIVAVASWRRPAASCGG